MTPFTSMLVFTTVAGACILLGGLIARIESIRPRWLEQELRHSVIAFGGGILIAAIALVLVPEGADWFPHPYWGTALFLAGGVTFMLAEIYLSRRQQQIPQTLAMLLDFVPESLVMGGMFALGSPSAPLLAVFVGLQNLPEGFNAYRELMAMAKGRPRRALILMALLALLGPLAGIAGWSIAADYSEAVGATMLFASGGILYLVFQDIAPQAHLDRHWAPTLGAVVGFCLGMLANALVGV